MSSQPNDSEPQAKNTSSHVLPSIDARSWIKHVLPLSVLIYLVVFLKINAFHMRWWDESMFAVNAYEMLHNGKYFSLYFNGSPDIINSKPPLTVWLQVLSIKAFGYNELAIRLPSAIAAAVSVLVVFFFMRRRLGNEYAWLSALILLTSVGFLGFHTGRTGDSDSLLTLFTLLSNVYFIRFTEEKKGKEILWFWLFLFLGFATKMYAALLFLPAYFVILIVSRCWHAVLRSWQFYGGLLGFISLAAILFYMRERESPGYLHEVFFKDAGRVFKVIEGHNHSWEYYLDNLAYTRFSFWFVPCLISVCLYLFNRIRKPELFRNLLFLAISYLLIITVSVTKLLWYDMPLYPGLAMMTAFGLGYIFEYSKQTSLDVRRIVLFFIIFIYPYWLMFRRSQANIIPNGEKKVEAIERYIFANEKDNSLDGVKIYSAGWRGAQLFYKYKLGEKGMHLSITSQPAFFASDKILVCDDSLIVEIGKRYYFHLINQDEGAAMIRIDGDRQRTTNL